MGSRQRLPGDAAMPRRLSSPIAMDDKCCLTVLKGLVEHQNTEAYFGSLLGHRGWQEATAARGWIVRDGTAWLVTQAGRQAYETSGVAALEPKTYYYRWYAWSWEGVRVVEQPAPTP